MPALIGTNGRAFDPARIDLETKLGTTEIWEITSIGMAHPFHVHGALFRIFHELANSRATPPIALTTTTSNGGARQTARRAKPTRATPKSPGVFTEFVQTGL